MNVPNVESAPLLSFEEFRRFAETHEGKWELTEGVPVQMASATDEHQWICLEIAATFREYLKGHNCKVRLDLDVWTGRTPFDASKPAAKGSVRRPDVLIFCDKAQRQNSIILSPQLVVEVWSPTNTNVERSRKLAEYYRIGVKEFWQIDYTEREFSILAFAEGNLRFLSGGTFREPLESEYFPGLKVDLSEYYSEFG